MCFSLTRMIIISLLIGGNGLLWWFLGPLTLLPLLLHQPVDWSYLHGSAFFGSLIGHAVYGILLGLLYAWGNRLWVGLFIESDPLKRQEEGPGIVTLRSLEWGALASILGGLLFSIIMVATGVLPQVAALIRGSSALAGFAVHLVISVLIGRLVAADTVNFLKYLQKAQ